MYNLTSIPAQQWDVCKLWYLVVFKFWPTITKYCTREVGDLKQRRLQYLHIFNAGLCRCAPRNFKPANEDFVSIEGRSFKSLLLVWFPTSILVQTHDLLLKHSWKSACEKLDATTARCV